MASCSLCDRLAIYFICGQWVCPFCAFKLLGRDAPGLVFIDVETTGFDPYNDAIVQLSALRYQGNEKVDVLNTYINPLRKISPDATKKHGITDQMVRSCPPIKEMQSRFMELIKGSILVGYNVLFDLRFLNRAFKGALTGALYIDLLPAVKGRFDVPNNKLETVATHLGFQPENKFHDALTDCEATAAIYFHLLCTGWQENVLEYRETVKDLQGRWGSKNMSPTQIVPTKTPEDKNHPFYGKKIVFTGELSIDRAVAMQMVVDAGATIKSCVSGKTDFLVVGAQDLALVGYSGVSAKEEKAREINDSGKGHIQILSEEEFFDLAGLRMEEDSE